MLIVDPPLPHQAGLLATQTIQSKRESLSNYNSIMKELTSLVNDIDNPFPCTDNGSVSRTKQRVMLYFVHLLVTPHPPFSPVTEGAQLHASKLKPQAELK